MTNPLPQRTMIHPSSAIRTAGLSKNLGGRQVLRGIDLQIVGGECVALMGSNGAGKTTLLRCLAAITRPTSGEVFWFNRPAAASPEDRRLVGAVAHESRLYSQLTPRENLLFAARMCAVADPARRAEELLAQTGLQPLADRQVRQISKGMRQRLALVRALIHEPPILLLDEPFSGLDGASRDWLLGLLGEQRAGGRAVCFATHNEEDVRQLATRTVILQRGSMAGGHEAERASAGDDTGRDAA